jgi:hypothetical protein
MIGVSGVGVTTAGWISTSGEVRAQARLRKSREMMHTGRGHFGRGMIMVVIP